MLRRCWKSAGVFCAARHNRREECWSRRAYRAKRCPYEARQGELVPPLAGLVLTLPGVNDGR